MSTNFWNMICAMLAVCPANLVTTTTTAKAPTSTIGRAISTSSTAHITSTSSVKTTSSVRTTSTSSVRSTTSSIRTSTSSTRSSTSSTRSSSSSVRSSTSSSTRSSSSSTTMTSSLTISGSTASEIVPTFSSSTISTATVSLSSANVPTATISPNSTANVTNYNVASTILVIARDSTSASVAAMGLNGYGIPFETLIVPSTGTTLPTLNTTAGGNYGGIVVVSAVAYDQGTAGYVSALTTAQWNQLYAYQMTYGVRMMQSDVWPDSTFGVTALGGCCGTGVEQYFSFSNTTGFTQAGLKTGATLSTIGLYHYPATITDPTTTWEIAQFASNANFANTSTAAVINNFSGREQMVFFVPFSQDWSPTSNVLQHAWITWMTRGLYAGFRRVYFNTQIDDMFLETDIYYPNNSGTYRVTTTDMNQVASWITTINAKMNTGSSYSPEIGHNGNGVVEQAEGTTKGENACTPGSIEYDSPYIETALEFQKPLGTGTNEWPTSPTTYGYSTSCLALDALEQWFTTTANRDKFFHITHTFTHLELNNATYSDALKEITFNQAFLSASGIANGKFTADGLIPPAITGLHNGDVLRAWHDAGLTNCVGDNTRPLLLNPTNPMWPLITNVSANGYDGFQVNPRWATRIYYNCDTPNCTLQEWIATSAGSGTFDDLLTIEKQDTTRHLFGLYHDPYMFHQANLRSQGIADITINGVTSNISLFQSWVETVVQEFIRLVNWPMISLQHTTFSQKFMQRMTRDACGYNMAYTVSNQMITGVTLTANGNTCSTPIPVTVPGTVTNTQGFTTEQVGNDPLTIWITLSGSPVSFTLSSPIALM